MIQGLLVVGLIAGTMLFLGKLVIYFLVLSIFPKRLKAWIYRTPIAMIAVDALFAFLAAPVMAMAGGTIAMLTMITFTFWSGLFICFNLAKRKVIKEYNNIFATSRSIAW